jgi:hypothetical protein
LRRCRHDQGFAIQDAQAGRQTGDPIPIEDTTMTLTLGRQLGVAFAAAGLLALTLGAASAQRGGTFDLVQVKPPVTTFTDDLRNWNAASGG